MYVSKFILYTAFCLNITTAPTSADVWHVNHLLQNQFWSTLVSDFPDAQICGIDQQTVSVRELFATGPSYGRIVNGSNLADKTRQYHDLLTVVFSDVLVWNLTYFMTLKRFHVITNSSWSLYDLTWQLIVSSHYVYTPMKYALSFARRMYRESWGLPGDPPPLDKQLHRDLKFILSVRDNPNVDLLGKLDEMMFRWQQFLSTNRDIVNWRNTLSDIYPITDNVVQVVARDNNNGNRWALSRMFMMGKLEDFVKEIEEIGFRYRYRTEETMFL